MASMLYSGFCLLLVWLEKIYIFPLKGRVEGERERERACLWWFTREMAEMAELSRIKLGARSLILPLAWERPYSATL